MGWQATGWAFKAPIENPGCKFVLVALAERASNEDDDADEWFCFPSIETIQKYTAQGYRTVQRHLDWLEANGFISRERRHMGKGRKGSYNYTLHRFPQVFDKMAGGQNGPSDRPIEAPEPAPIGRTEPVSEPIKVTTQERVPARARFVPDGWLPSFAHEEKALALGLTAEQAKREHEKFRNHEYDKPKTDWDRAFHKWLEIAADRLKGQGNGPGQSPRPSAGLQRSQDRLGNYEAGLMAFVDGHGGPGRGPAPDLDQPDPEGGSLGGGAGASAPGPADGADEDCGEAI